MSAYAFLGAASEPLLPKPETHLLEFRRWKRSTRRPAEQPLEGPELLTSDTDCAPTVADFNLRCNDAVLGNGSGHIAEPIGHDAAQLVEKLPGHAKGLTIEPNEILETAMERRPAHLTNAPVSLQTPALPHYVLDQLR